MLGKKNRIRSGFLEKSEDTKSRFEIIWPLDAYVVLQLGIIRSKARKIWQSWKMKAKFWSIWILRLNKNWINNF